MPHYNRYRSRDPITAPMGAWYYILSPAGCSLAANTRTDVAAGYTQGRTEYMLDVDSGDWQKRKGKEFVFNDMYKTWSVTSCTGQTNYTLTSVANRCNSPVLKSTNQVVGELMVVWFGNTGHLTVPTITPSAITKLTDEVWTKCLANRMKGDATLLETFAELSKTLAMLRSPMENLTTLIRTTRRSGKRSRGYSRVKADSFAYIQFASSEWLRFRYGVMPIVREVQAVMKALERGHASEPVVVKAQSSGTISGTESVNSNNGGSVVYVTANKSTAHTVKVRAYWYDRFVRTIWNDFGLSGRDLTGLAWELLRYSMVVDWFINVGDVIYANAPRAQHTPLGGQVLIEQDINTFMVPTSVTNIQPSVWTMAGGVSDTVRWTTKIIDRQSRVPTSNFVVKTDFGFGNWERTTDAFTLVAKWLHSIGFDRH